MISSEQQAELRAKYNPDGSNLRRMQLHILEMLKYIDKVCRENNIKYWLSAGSCLGAVRHGGFIPWDDDVDIEMERKDYIKFYKILNSEQNDRYILHSYFNDKEYLYPFDKLRDKNSYVKESYFIDDWIKFHGCFIDIFTIEPSNSKYMHILSSKIWWHTLTVFAKIKNESLRRKFIFGGHLLNRRILYPLFAMLSKFNSNGVFRHSYGSPFPNPRFVKDFKETTLAKFEDGEFPIPKGYDHYLKSIYGDYTKIPSNIESNSHFEKIIL